jgi:hypothetical protein
MLWETLDTCYERPEKYMEEVLRPIVEFRRYKITDRSGQGVLLTAESRHQGGQGDREVGPPGQ